ncbi:hypothetical protein DPMN_065796 [Dreissena polymorpha]|uniref:Uncharacterized protein n=1 Tax=Dreissena polymorpha TaxID=45954 RepID=A0A9D3YSA6_DREPO|nr:hypothetical protein DPMN_065796 [Dreissena polymorpha]
MNTVLVWTDGRQHKDEYDHVEAVVREGYSCHGIRYVTQKGLATLGLILLAFLDNQ